MSYLHLQLGWLACLLYKENLPMLWGFLVIFQEGSANLFRGVVFSFLVVA